MILCAIDPGSDQSAFVQYDTTTRRVVLHAIEFNDQILTRLAQPSRWPLVIESFESYGMAVGAEVFRTVWWSGRFFQAWRGPAYQLPRRTVKLHLCHSVRATDANVRTAIVDRFGATKAEAIGTKKAPGPLYGLKSHCFAALAVALTWAETHEQETPTRAPDRPLVVDRPLA